MRSVWGIARADFIERSRRFSFVAMIALALFGAYCFVPDNNLNVIIVEPELFMQGGHPSWMTIASAWGITFFLPLLGFFYVSNSLAYDELTGVRQLAATSPSYGLPYMIGKYLSNALLLYCMVFAVFLGSLVMMLIRFTGQFISLYSVASPYLIFLSPVLLISALAVFFDSTRFLRKSIGAVSYIAVSFFVLFRLTEKAGTVASFTTKIFDFTGMTILSEYIGREVLEQSGNQLHTLKILAGGGKKGFTGTQTLIFHGVDWQPSDILGLFIMALISLAIVAVSVPIYKAVNNGRSHTSMHKKAIIATAVDSLPENLAAYTPREVTVTNHVVGKLLAEMKLTLSDLPVMWWFVALCGVVITIFLPLSTAQAVLPIFLLWPISIYSAMGCREHIHDTLHIIAVLPKGLFLQSLLSWISGMLITLLAAAPVILRMFISGQYRGIFVCLCGVVFIPSLALFLGEWTKTPRAFEVIYVVLVYLAMNGAQQAGYLEMHPQLLSITRAGIYLLIGIAAAIMAIIKRTGFIESLLSATKNNMI